MEWASLNGRVESTVQKNDVEVCSLEELLFLSLLVPPSVDTERVRRDVSGLAAIASQITVHVKRA